MYAYGGGSGIIQFSGFLCTGNESYLLNCSVYYTAYDYIHCTHFEDAGVRCPNGELALDFQVTCRVGYVVVDIRVN